MAFVKLCSFRSEPYDQATLCCLVQSCHTRYFLYRTFGNWTNLMVYIWLVASLVLWIDVEFLELGGFNRSRNSKVSFLMFLSWWDFQNFFAHLLFVCFRRLPQEVWTSATWSMWWTLTSPATLRSTCTASVVRAVSAILVSIWKWHMSPEFQWCV